MKKLLFLLLTACGAPTHWQLASLSTGSSVYDAARLTYRTEDRLGGLSLEIVQNQGTLSAYLNSPSRKLTTPRAAITIGGEVIDVPLDIRQGQMRARLPDEIALWAARALQDGRTVGIIVGSSEQTIEPEQFSRLYSKLTGGMSSFLDSIQGPLQ